MKTHAFESYREKYENDLTDPGTFFTDIAEAAVGGPEKSVPPAPVRERFRVRGFRSRGARRVWRLWFICALDAIVRATARTAGRTRSSSLEIWSERRQHCCYR